MTNIQIIDGPCGCGKSTWAIQNINQNPDESFIFCTPFLDEIDRVRKACGNYNRFEEPNYYTSSKIESFNSLLADGKDICVTHTTFLNATQETLDLIRTSSYTLVIDESETRQAVTKDDISFLIKRGIIQVDENNRVSWLGGEHGTNFKFSEVKRYADLKRLYCIGETLLLAVFPPEMFTSFDQVYILTYMFGGSLFKYYLDMYGLEYELKSVQHNDDGYFLSDYDPSIEKTFRQNCKELIHICEQKNLNVYNRTALSKNWFENGQKDRRIHDLQNHLLYYFQRYLKGTRARSADIMWTCYEDYKSSLKGKGYTVTRALTKRERQLPTKEREQLEKQLSCFVPCNSKATNIYRKRWALAYCVNLYINPMIRRFFTDGNGKRVLEGKAEINPDEDLFALSCMIQWIFRSRIRDENRIELYIPSKRMRELLIKWLDNRV